MPAWCQAKNRSGLFAVMVRYGDQIDVFHGTVRMLRRRANPFVAAWREVATGPSAIRSASCRALEAAGLDALAAGERRGIHSPGVARHLRHASHADEVNGVSGRHAAGQARSADRPPARAARSTPATSPSSGPTSCRTAAAATAPASSVPGTTLFAGWIRDCIAANMPYDRFVTEILTAVGSQETNPPTVWYRTVRTTPRITWNRSRRRSLACASSAPSAITIRRSAGARPITTSLAAVFARVGRKGGFRRRRGPHQRNHLSGRRGRGRSPADQAGDAAAAAGRPGLRSSAATTIRAASLAEWMTAADNPFFARTMANRMWGHFFGRGIIHPIDDARSTNPPSNPELLDALARDFVASGYDVKHLIRVICNSAAYGLSSVPNETNRDDVQSFARYYPRRLPAEVLLDAFSQVLDVPTKFRSVAGDFPRGRGPSTCPTRRCPASSSTCSAGPPQLGLRMRTGRRAGPGPDPGAGQLAEIQEKLTADKGYVRHWRATARRTRRTSRDIFLRVFARPPRPRNWQSPCQFLEAQTDRKEAYGSLLWSLLATNEFLFNH